MQPFDLEQYKKESLEIEPMALQEEFVRLPSDLSYWSSRYADAFGTWKRAELASKQVYARRLLDLREEMKTAGVKATVGEVGAAVEADGQYLQARGLEITAEEEKVRLWGVVEALRAKKDMLVQLGSHARMEMQNDPTIRRQSEIEREVARNRQER